MRNSHAFVSVLVALGLIAVSLCCAWLVRRELRITDVAEASTRGKREAQSINGVRNRLYDMRERYNRISALNVGSRVKKADTLFRDLQSRADSVSLSLGEKLRPEPAKPFAPKAYFLSYSRGASFLQYVSWKLSKGSAAYTFRLRYSHRDLADEIIADVSKGDEIGEFKLVSDSSPTLPGGSYEKVVRITTRGKKLTQRVPLPRFRIIKLGLERRSGPAEQVALEVWYNDDEKRKAELSNHPFHDVLQSDIPLADITINDDPEAGDRLITVREGSKFLFAGEEYLVLTIQPDHIDVCHSASRDAVESWPLSENPAEN